MNFDRAWCQWYTKMEGNVGRWIFFALKGSLSYFGNPVHSI